ncbi:MAG: 1-(5-phosphoribosyl)-5-[(5-phosphoribosylamino)methylideneamino]imidazole-4-carboxamide isomerase [Candidatus Caenarcaniphilales bacterium]|nr:1-(5-phosphoribosyl)-5-[(5-phosphoribosylamino)methylideneamino]imidazole-4-carboxamide isomerase [Candidatus Caenarcaniphilales bacterium]
MIELIPAIDLYEGNVVRLLGGDYSQITQYGGTPGDSARYWLEQGATRLHVIDLEGAREGRLINIKGLEQILATGIEVQFGGGIRSWDTIEHLFELGIRHAILGTAAVKDPDLMLRALKVYKQHILLALDARDGKVSVEGWLEDSEITTHELLEKLSTYGLGRFIYTDISRDGKLEGPDISGAVELCQKFTHLKCILAGGVSSLEDLQSIKDQASHVPNLEGIISGKALYENKISLKEAQKLLTC